MNETARPQAKTFTGSCHCGAIRFEADIDLAKGTIRCNCSLCTKLRCWPAIVGPAAFRLLQGKGELAVYRCNSLKEQHLFCRHCGVRPYGIGDSPRWGPYYAVSVNCLDNIGADELAAAPITYLDGRNDNFDAPPADLRNL